MPDTRVEVLLGHGLSQDLVEWLGQHYSRVEDAAASVSRHEAGQCGGTDGRCPWHGPQTVPGRLDEVSRAINAWMLTGWAERGLFENRGPEDAGVV